MTRGPFGPRLVGYLLLVNDCRRGFLHRAVALLDAVEVVLDDAVAALAEILAQRLFDAFVDLLVGLRVAPQSWDSG